MGASNRETEIYCHLVPGRLRLKLPRTHPLSRPRRHGRMQTQQDDSGHHGQEAARL
jgi:hypothetical protein